MSGEAVGIAIGAAAMAQANAAQHEAHVAICEAVVRSYEAQPLVVQKAQEYAECISFLYPPASGAASDVIMMKLLFVIFIVSLVGTFVWTLFNSDYDWLEKSLFTAMGAILIPLAVGIVMLIGYGFYWLFT